MSKLQFWNTTIIYTIGFLGLRALSFILLPLYTNLLSAHQAGILFIIYTILAFLNTIYNRGMDSALLKFFNSSLEKSIISTSVLYSVIYGIILSAVLLFWHTIANRIITLISNIFSDLNLSDVETGYKVFRKKLISEIKLNTKLDGSLHAIVYVEAGKKGVVVGREGRNAEKARLLAKRYFNISTVMINNQEMTQLEV